MTTDHPAVAAVLAQTPTNGSGHVITRGPGGHGWQTGSPEPIAARQAVAVHGDIADWLEDQDTGTCGCGCGCTSMIRKRADEIEAQYPATQQDGEANA